MSCIDGIPTFKVVRDGPHMVKFRCPKCGRVNRHGVPQDSEPHHKVSHCLITDCWPQGYYIVYEEAGR